MSKRYEISADVVLRQFAQETIVLNVATGKYHGLNPTAGRMMEVLGRERSVEAAVRVLAEDYDRPVGDIEPALRGLIDDLLARDLIVCVDDR